MLDLKETAVKPGKPSIYFEQALLVERTVHSQGAVSGGTAAHCCRYLSSRVPQGWVLHADGDDESNRCLPAPPLRRSGTTQQMKTCKIFCGSHSGEQLPHFDVTSAKKDGAGVRIMQETTVLVFLCKPRATWNDVGLYLCWKWVMCLFV